jgi:hypothetical protein
MENCDTTYYIKHPSIVFDLTIVADTVKVILRERAPSEHDRRAGLLGERLMSDRSSSRGISTRYLAIATEAALAS